VGKDAQSYGNSNTDGKYRTIASIEGKENPGEAGYVNYQLQSPPVFTNANEMLDIYLNPSARGVWNGDYNNGNRDFRSMRDIFFEQVKDMNLELADNCPSPEAEILVDQVGAASIGGTVTASLKVDEKKSGIIISKDWSYLVYDLDGFGYPPFLSKASTGSTASVGIDFPGVRSVSVRLINEFGKEAIISKNYTIPNKAPLGGSATYSCPYFQREGGYLINGGITLIAVEDDSYKGNIWKYFKRDKETYWGYGLTIPKGRAVFHLSLADEGGLGASCQFTTSCPDPFPVGEDAQVINMAAFSCSAL
jgi:hypothetical protein